MIPWTAISASLFSMAIMLFLGGVLLFVLFLYKRRQALRSPATRAAGEDLAGMMILFHNMREILDQQKALARQLNREIDAKLAQMNRSVEACQSALEKLVDREHKLNAGLEEARDDLTSVQQQLQNLHGDHERDWPAPRRPDAYAAEPRREASPSGRREAPALFRAVAETEAGALVHEDDPWVGLDFGQGDSPLAGVEVPSETPETPEDAEAAREAFRTLLDMQPEAAPRENPRDDPESEETPGPNGQGRVTPIQKRVYEYTDAGMTVPQIARELGIGKGEVRLILSLRRERAR